MAFTEFCYGFMVSHRFVRVSLDFIVVRVSFGLLMYGSNGFEWDFGMVSLLHIDYVRSVKKCFILVRVSLASISKLLLNFLKTNRNLNKITFQSFEGSNLTGIESSRLCPDQFWSWGCKFRHGISSGFKYALLSFIS